MLEPKAKNELSAPEVLAKKDVAVKWCKQASDHAKTYNGKPWEYLLIPHDAIAENMTIAALAAAYTVPFGGRPAGPLWTGTSNIEHPTSNIQ